MSWIDQRPSSLSAKWSEMASALVMSSVRQMRRKPLSGDAERW